ncbi:hypothetical protein CCACVL1_23787 [Corchorus capsularis]|uniref:Uncharacterized protein n=1 Tax=Corchorus capsularis TaxID=210143 RepID=A0A1R3GSA5_COCAP|nr:hypothetical protein CCACVL1_23787 [Corchorus capsularis]
MAEMDIDSSGRASDRVSLSAFD